jgi:hypothetical protein
MNDEEKVEGSDQEEMNENISQEQTISSPHSLSTGYCIAEDFAVSEAIATAKSLPITHSHSRDFAEKSKRFIALSLSCRIYRIGLRSSPSGQKIK